MQNGASSAAVKGQEVLSCLASMQLKDNQLEQSDSHQESQEKASQTAAVEEEVEITMTKGARLDDTEGAAMCAGQVPGGLFCCPLTKVCFLMTVLAESCTSKSSRHRAGDCGLLRCSVSKVCKFCQVHDLEDHVWQYVVAFQILPVCLCVSTSVPMSWLSLVEKASQLSYPSHMISWHRASSHLCSGSLQHALS